MKLSQREKYLLALIGSVLIGVLYYQFLYVPQIEKIAQKQTELNETQARHDEVMQNIATLAEREVKIEELSTTINEQTIPYYPEIIQEKMILTLDELVKVSEVEAVLSFSPITVTDIASMKVPVVERPQSSLTPYVDEYKVLTQVEGEDLDESADVEVPQTTETTETSSQVAATAQLLTVGVTFSGTYEQAQAFINNIQGHRYNIAITNLSLAPQAENVVAGNMNLEFFAIPKLEDQDQEYLEWTLKNTYGKDYPFSTGAVTGSTSGADNELNVSVNDFMMVVRSTASDLPSITLGKSNDTKLETYVYSEVDDHQDVEITLSEEAGKYYYRYKTAESAYPVEGGKGVEFVPYQEKIQLHILSEARVNENDKTSVSIKVINQTKLDVNVEVENDDQTNPRVNVVSEGGAVNVIKK